MNIEELKRLAEAANKGFSGLPWQVIMERNNHGSTHYRVRGHCEASIAVEPDQYWEEDYDPPTDEYGYFQPDDRMDCDLVRVDIARHIAAANPAAVLELIRQRDELLIAAKDAHQVLRDWVGYIPSSTIQEDLNMLGIAITNAEKQS